MEIMDLTEALSSGVLNMMDMNYVTLEVWRSNDYDTYKAAKKAGGVYKASNASHGYAALVDRIEGYRDCLEVIGTGTKLKARVTVINTLASNVPDERVFSLEIN